MHISENEGIEDKTFVVTGGLGFVGAALCLELVRRGARLVKAFDLRTQSPWSDQLRQKGVHCIQGDASPHISPLFLLFSLFVYANPIQSFRESMQTAV